MNYGHAPSYAGRFDIELDEFMHYQYLPVAMPGVDEIRMPRRLDVLRPMIEAAIQDAGWLGHTGPYVYLTARRGWASPDNPLNRPGWHCDGFGSDDLNYIWWNRWATRFAVQPFHGISQDHDESMRQFREQVDPEFVIAGAAPKVLYRLTPYVVHATPEVEEPGGMRSFVKVSVSRDRYNLEGNSHNYAFDYNWRLFPREAVRNHPVHAGKDYYRPE